MKFEIIETEDGSTTLKNSQVGQTYHSIFGAVAEANHVFIENGLKKCQKQNVSILEIGFGTGLNAFVTMLFARKNNLKIHYKAIEKFPVPPSVYQKLNFNFATQNERKLFLQLHETQWQRKVRIEDYFVLEKLNVDFTVWRCNAIFDIVFFDSFSYDLQPQMWSVDVFRKLYDCMNTGTILVTYSAKGIVKQNLRAAGFEVKRLKGFKKYHMLNAIKH